MSEKAIIVNGETRTFAAAQFPATLLQLVQALALEPERLVAEVDGDVVRSDAFEYTPVQEGSKVELVQFVGGG